MPIYDYRCKDCGTILEILATSSDDRIIHSPEYNGQYINKLISASYLDKSLPGVTCYELKEHCAIPSCSSGNNCQRR
jgi:putative FmdB family regulatory protein